MQGLKDPSLLSTKKNPTPAGDDEGRIRPTFSDVVRYSVMASFSSPEKEYRRPLGIRSTAQSYEWCGGRDRALVLLKTLLSWW